MYKAYICDIDLRNGWSSEWTKTLSNAADHSAENSQQCR